MADERAGTVHTLSGRLEDGAGKTADAAMAEAANLKDQATGAMKEAYDKTVDAAVEGAEAVKGAAIASHDFLRKFMEENPHTTTVIALGVGLLIGYSATRQPARRGWWD
jgi:ElaB/YqjD/DUF883 family membrane-anchored ribosome-binding protein